MASRKIIIPIDSVLELFKSYTAENNEIPLDAKPVTLMVRPTEKGQFAIIAESADWTRDLPPLIINFDIQRSFLV
jgi:hypothetical protein